MGYNKSMIERTIVVSTPFFEQLKHYLRVGEGFFWYTNARPSLILYTARNRRLLFTPKTTPTGKPWYKKNRHKSLQLNNE